MKTDPKNSNASRAPSHPELTATDNNPRRLFEVNVFREDFFSAKCSVEATSEREAEQKATELAEGGELPQWDFIVSEVYHAECVQAKKGGLNNV